MRSSSLVVAAALAAVAVFPGGPAGAAEAAGVVRTVSGTAFVTRDGHSLAAVAGTRVSVGDTLVTGRASSLGVILRDDSTLSLGEETSLVLRDFDFAPAEGKLGILVRITRGAMAYLSGRIAKLAPETARFDTPVASIGIRGTRFAVKVGAPAPD